MMKLEHMGPLSPSWPCIVTRHSRMTQRSLDLVKWMECRCRCTDQDSVYVELRSPTLERELRVRMMIQCPSLDASAKYLSFD
jgi:hypothetical protein